MTRSMIEARPESDLNRALPEWKALRAQGWQVSVVVGEGRAVMLASRSAAEAQLSLLAERGAA